MHAIKQLRLYLLCGLFFAGNSENLSKVIYTTGNQRLTLRTPSARRASRFSPITCLGIDRHHSDTLVECGAQYFTRYHKNGSSNAVRVNIGPIDGIFQVYQNEWLLSSSARHCIMLIEFSPARRARPARLANCSHPGHADGIGLSVKVDSPRDMTWHYSNRDLVIILEKHRLRTLVLATRTINTPQVSLPDQLYRMVWFQEELLFLAKSAIYELKFFGSGKFSKLLASAEQIVWKRAVENVTLLEHEYSHITGVASTGKEGVFLIGFQAEPFRILDLATNKLTTLLHGNQCIDNKTLYLAFDESRMEILTGYGYQICTIKVSWSNISTTTSMTLPTVNESSNSTTNTISSSINRTVNHSQTSTQHYLSMSSTDAVKEELAKKSKILSNHSIYLLTLMIMLSLVPITLVIPLIAYECAARRPQQLHPFEFGANYTREDQNVQEQYTQEANWQENLQSVYSEVEPHQMMNLPTKPTVCNRIKRNNQRRKQFVRPKQRRRY